MNGKRKFQHDGTEDAPTPHPTRRTRHLDEDDLLSDALQPSSLKRVSPRSAAKKEEAPLAVAADSVHSPGTSKAQDPEPPVTQAGPSSTAHVENGNPEAALQLDNAPRGGPGASRPPSRPFTPYTGVPFSPNTDISIGGCSYGTPEQLEESEFPEAPCPAPGDAIEDDHEMTGDDSYNEDSSVNITDEEDNSSQGPGWPDGTASDATAVPAPDTLSTMKGMSIESLADARRALAVAIVKMEANERDTGLEADATIFLHHMKQRLRPGDREALDQLQMDIFLDRLQVHPNKTIKAKACQLYSKETGYVLSSKPAHSTKPLVQLHQDDEAAVPPSSDAELREDADDCNMLRGAASGQAGNAAAEAGSSGVGPPPGQQELACHDGTFPALLDQGFALESRPSGPQQSGVRSLASQGISFEVTQAGQASERQPENNAQDGGGGRANMPHEDGPCLLSSETLEGRTSAGNSARGFLPKDMDAFGCPGPAGQAVGPTSPVDSRQRRSGKESSQEHVDGKEANSGVEANAVAIPDTFPADSNRLTTPPTPPGSWLASPRLLNTSSKHDARKLWAVESNMHMLANMQGVASEPFARPLSSSSNANPSSQGAVSSGSRARNSDGAGVGMEAKRRRRSGSYMAHSLADASEWPTSQGLARAGSSESLPFPLDTVLKLEKVQQNNELFRMHMGQKVRNGSVAHNSEGAGCISNASWVDNLGISAGQSPAIASQGFPSQEKETSLAHAAHTMLSGLLSIGISAATPAARGDASSWSEASGACNQSTYLQGLTPRASPRDCAARTSSLLGSRSDLQGAVPAELNMGMTSHGKTAHGGADIHKQVRNWMRTQIQGGQVEGPPQPHGPPSSGSVQRSEVRSPRSGLHGTSSAELVRPVADDNTRSEGMVMPSQKGLEHHQILQRYQRSPNGPLEPPQGRQDQHTLAAQASIRRGREDPANAGAALQRRPGGARAQAKAHSQREKQAAQMVHNEAMVGLDSRHSLVPVLESRVIAQRMQDQNPRMALGFPLFGMPLHGSAQQQDVAQMERLLSCAPHGMSREDAARWLQEQLVSIRAARSYNGLGMTNMGQGLGRLVPRDALDQVQQMNKTFSQAAARHDRVQQALQALAATRTYGQVWDAPAMGSGLLPNQSQADMDEGGAAVMEMLRQFQS